jgi:predicted secreted protein
VLRVTAPALAMVLFAAPAAASGPDSDPAPDPLRSVMWSDMRALLLGGGPVMFDERVRVAAPASAEDALNVPVMVDASSLDAREKVEEIVVFADMNPIPRILNYRPSHAKPLIGLRLKLQQATRSAPRQGHRTASGMSAGSSSMRQAAAAPLRPWPMAIRNGSAIWARFRPAPGNRQAMVPSG